MINELRDVFFMYQPKYHDNNIFGYEALLRANVDNEMKFPIKLLEKFGDDLLFDFFIINSVITDIVNSRKTDFKEKPVSINISAKFISVPIDLDKIDISAIENHNLKIELEILESSKIIDIDICNENILLLKSIGITVSIDDFGSDYSTIRRLISVKNINYVKLDQRLIADIEHDPSIVPSIGILFDFIHSLDFKIIAEGVENKNILETLRSIGIEYFQGFYFSKPLLMDSAIHELPLRFLL
ncbi:hypothetical protein C0W54_04445 [Photobacterium kishitanii]|uniref:EAL domain-containing protein n=1 Tax=Photobacterium kishitanii TaxID=318456 RepID=UPI000D16CD14|nr:EAL domain-containing protein [Photobacterium kishitanii]PSW62767.1 hypothetical protein C0W54_04445 [Photobacterium kishitanii]